MEEDVKFIIEDTADKMSKTVLHLDGELGKVRAGKANPKMLEVVIVDFYGSMSQLEQISNINTPDALTIDIQPWDRKMIPLIEKAIMAANLGMNPDNNGEIVRINVPPLTEERRKDLVKQVKKLGEDGKITVRNIRRDSNDELKKLKKDGLPEDQEKDAQDVVQKLTDKHIQNIDELLVKKEKDIMTV
jgi:ribosome recycling factor